MDERLNRILNEIKLQKPKEKEKIISLYKEASKIISDNYDKNREQSLESSSRMKKILNELGKVNISIFDYFGGYLCSHKKKVEVEDDFIQFIYQSLVNQDEITINNKSETDKNNNDEYEKKYYESLDKIDSLKAEIREKNKINEEVKKYQIKMFQKILGMIGAVPKIDNDEKIIHYISDFFEDEGITVLWTSKSEEESNVFDILKTTLDIANEVILPALVKESVIIEKGLIYRKEK